MNLRKSFSLPFSGSELWYSCLDSLKKDFSLIREKILEEEKQISRPSNSSLILYHLYDTEITQELADTLVRSWMHCRGYIRKLAVIGLTRSGKTHVKKSSRAFGLQLDAPIEYFDDLEKAKEWLVG